MVSLMYKGRSIAVAKEPTTAEQLLNTILENTEISRETLKIVHKGRAVELPADGSTSLAELGLANSKLLLIGSSAEDVTTVREGRDLPGMASIEHETRILIARRKRATQSQQLPKGPYIFQQFESWQRPSLHPPPEEAFKLLHRLATDPGIVEIMNAHQWTVSKLSEMPPEGKVGVSPVCILGVNINAGQEISLRLRTDDLKGFRRYQSIKQTLCHELAHMVFQEHDANFKSLNSTLWRKCQQASSPKGMLLSNAAEGWDDKPSNTAVPQSYRLGSDDLPREGTAVHPLIARLEAEKEQAFLDNTPDVTALGHRDQQTESKEREVEAFLEAPFAPPREELGSSPPCDKAAGGHSRTVQAIEEILASTEMGEARQALQLLVTVLQNVVNSPDERKYHRLRLDNPAFRRRLGSSTAPLEILAAAGFSLEVEGHDRVLALREADAHLLVQILTCCETALQNIARTIVSA